MTVRRAMRIRGLVQGVGFRPYVHRLASRHGLGGFVRNQAGDVVIEVEGSAAALDRFAADLLDGLPPLARIDELRWEARPPRCESGFMIVPSVADAVDAPQIGPDVAACDDCLREMFDPRDRRFRYPFLNCTNCGPRLTAIVAVPYDRARTTMAAFAMCAACRREYEDPANRRFHAELTACPACGPRLALHDAAGIAIAAADPLAAAVAALRDGRIVAVKGIGGYHLACLAADERAVRELRRRKHREEKPLAVMVADLAAARAICHVSPAETAMLTDPARPIVLLARRSAADDPPPIAAAVAPGNPLLGVMLAYAPLHHLLLADLGGPALVMTSGNRCDEPIAYEDADAFERLAGIADLFLTHNRGIHLRCDDSILRATTAGPMVLRRARGHAPSGLPLPLRCPVPILAAGGQLKATFALGQHERAFLSHHLGDLDDFAARRAYAAAVTHFENLLGIHPSLIAHDLHPDYATTRYAAERCAAPDNGRPPATPTPRRLGVQHHHAHLAACLADAGVMRPAIGVIFDGTGYGSDGTIWGGEFLVGDLLAFRRAAHLRNVPMPGGEQAIRQPWRMAAAHLLDAVGDCGPLSKSVEAKKLDVIARMAALHLNSPLTSSVGRLFDAVAAVVGLRQTASFEGQAAIELEWQALRSTASGHYAFGIEPCAASDQAGAMVVDTRPLVADVANDVRRGAAQADIARRFHTTLVELIAAVCVRLREATGLNDAALSGGVFMNVVLLEETAARLTREGFCVYRHRRVPPNDGGLSFGQLAVAAARLATEPQAGD